MKAKLKIGSSTDTGQVRSENEDALVVAPPVYAVADGMGGHLAGEVASAMAVDTLRAMLAGTRPISSADELVAAVRSANLAIFTASHEAVEQRGMGTTLTALAVLAPAADNGPERLVLANVGDSRAYVLRGGRLQQLSVDHSYVHELVATGQISAEEARFHPNRNIVTRALGIEAEVGIDAWTLPLVRGDRFLLCSDGLVDEVSDDTINETLRGVNDPQKAAEELVATANRHGGRDNVTVVIVDVLDGAAPSDHPLDVTPEPVPDDGEGEIRAWRDDHRIDDTPPATRVLPATDGSSGSGSSSGAPRATATAPTPAPARTQRRPPRFTWRTLVFGFAVGAVFVAGFTMTAVYARSGYFVGFDGDDVVVFKGKTEPVLWFDATIERRTTTTRDSLSDAAVHAVENKTEFSSISAAAEYINGLGSLGPAATTSTTTTAAPTTSAATTVPGAVETPTTVAGG